MRKIIPYLFLGLVCCLWPSWSYGQAYSIANSALNVGNPGGLRTASDATTSGGISVLNGGSGSTTVNHWSSGISIPFSFNFYGSPVTHFIVSKNGLMTFDTTNSGLPVGAALNVNTALPNPNLPNNTIAFFWEDTSSTSIGTGDHVYTHTYGTAPNRQFWVHYYSFEVGSQSYCYWAAVLEETTDKIYVVDMNYANSPTSFTGTVGIQVNSTTAYEVTIPLNGTMGSPNIQMGTDGSAEANNEYYEFSYLAPGACIPPTALAASATTATTATASWTSGGAANSLVEYGPTGFTLGTGSTMYVATTSASLTGLSPNTTYDVYVKDSCLTNSSMFVGPLSFTTPCASVMSGTYTIDGSSPTAGTNFNSFGDALAELNGCGIGGPVTINVVQGTYSEQFEIGAIPGASSTNTVLIQAASANTLPAEVTFGATGSSSNYVLKFVGSQYVTVKGLTLTATGTSYGFVVDFEGANSFITLRDNVLNGVPATSTTTNYSVIYNSSSSADLQNNVSITNNEINNGSYGLYWYGLSSSPELNNSIDSNVIKDFYYYGIYSYYQGGVTFIGNTIAQSSTSAYVTGYGIRNYYGDSSQVIGNVISMYSSSTIYGVYNYLCDGSSSSPNIVANNMISCIGNTGTTYGIYAYNNYYTDIVYNSVNLTGGSSTAGRGIYLNSSTSGTFGFINLKNNNIVNTGGGYAFEVSSGAVTLGYVASSDYNNVYATGSSVARVNNSNFADISAYQLAVPIFDQNSVSVDPLFYSTVDLHVQAAGLNGAGQAYAGITTDIDGEIRSAAPDIGADEYVPPTCTPSTALVANPVYSDSATVSWVAGPGSLFNLEYGPAGFAKGTGTLITGLVDTFYTITNLLPAVDYDFYVQDDCGLGDTSIWTGPAMFSTNCPALFLAPYIQNFTTTVTPLCWNQSATSGGPWVFTGTPDFGSTYAMPDHTNGVNNNYAWVDQSGADAGVILEAPVVDVTSLATPYLSFWIVSHHNSSSITTYNKLYVESWNGTSWDKIDSVQGDFGLQWVEFRTDLSTHTYGSNLVQVRFRQESGGDSRDYDNDMLLDDVWIDDFSTILCSAPVVAPYTESFDTTTIPQCWTTYSSSSETFLFGSNTYGPASDHTGGTSYYANVDDSEFPSSSDVTLESPLVDVSGLTTPSLQFYLASADASVTVSVDVWDGAMWHTGVFTHAAATVATWDLMIVNLAPYAAGGTVAVRFVVDENNGTFQNDIGIDDVQFINGPSCYAPVGLGLVSSTSTDASVFWSTGGASDWNMEYGAAGFTLGTGTAINTINDTVTIASLSAATNYEFYVRDSCAVGDVSAWVGPFSFSTKVCAPANACTYMAELRDSYGDSWNGGEVTVWQSGVPVQVLSYPVINGGTNDTLLIVPIQLCDSLNTIVTLSNTGGFPEEMGFRLIDPMSNVAGNHAAVSGLSTGDTLFNFMSSCVLPMCLPPAALGAANITSVSADLYWTTGGAANWNVQYGPTGFAPGSGTMLAATNDTVALGSLGASTSYQFYVQDSCGFGNTSAWVGPFSFATLCGPISAFPWVENFETSAGSIPQCWVNETGDDSDWIFRNGSIGHGATTDHTLGTSAGYYGGVDDSQSLTTDTLNNLLTPEFDLTALTTPRLNFYHFIGNDNVLTSTLYIDVYDGTTWNMAVATINFTQAAWLQQLVNLTPYKSGNTRIRFRGVESTDYNSDISIDDITIEETPSCPAPSALGVANVTTTGADLLWTTGGAANWNVQHGPAGFILGSGTMSNSAGSTLSISGLAAASNYEFYVRDSCAVGDVSIWVGPFAFSTPACAPSASCTYMAELRDTYGDSWNGGEVTVWQSGVPVQVLTYPVINGGQNDTLLIIPIQLCDNLNTIVTISNVGGFPEEMGFRLIDPLSSIAGNHTAVGGLSTGDTLFNFMSSCVLPACPNPSALGSFNISQTSAEVYWTKGSAGAVSLVEYGPTGFTPGTGTLVMASNDTITLTGLVPSTSYDFCVTDSCGVANVSLTYCSGFTTSCAVFVAPFLETFDGTSTPLCWSETAISGGPWLYGGAGTNSVNCSPATDHTGNNGNYAWMDQSGADVGVVLQTPAVDVASITLPHLDFFYWMCGAGYAPDNKTFLEYWSGTNWVVFDSIVDSTLGWEYYAYDLSGKTYSTSLVQLRFRAESGGSSSDFFGDNAIDDVFIGEKRICQDPKGLAITGNSLSSITLAWNSDTTISGSRIAYGPTGFTIGTGTQMAAMPGGGTVSGLAAGTCYDFYIADSCGNSLLAWLGPINGCTQSPCSVTGTPSNVVGDTTNCGGGQVTLTTTTANNVAWLRGNEVVGRGSQHVDSVNFTTTFNAVLYNNAGPSIHVGPSPLALAGGFGNFNNGQWITVMDTITLDSFMVRSNGFVSAQMTVWDPDTAIDRPIQRSPVFTTPATGTVNTQVYTGGMVLTPGVYYVNIEFDANTVGALYRATAGAVFPYVAPGLMSIDSVNFNGGQIRYYYVFDMVIRGACLSTGVASLAFVPGSNAGSSDSVAVCITNTAVNLASYLGTHDQGGVWTDDNSSGALAAGVFDASAVAAGTYDFTYKLQGSGGCAADSATITVTVVQGGSAGPDTTIFACVTGASIQLRNYVATTGGIFTNLDNAQGVVGGSLIIPSTAKVGTFRFSYRLPGGICPADTVVLTVVIDATANAGGGTNDTVCDTLNAIDLTNYLDTSAVAGGAWKDVSGSGGLTGSVFNATAVISGSTYVLRYVVENGCGKDSADITLHVGCKIGLSEFGIAILEVYPNPTSGVVNIRSKNAGSQSVTIELYSSTGKLLMSANADLDGELPIDISRFADGVYNLKITTDEGTEVHRISKM